MASGKSLELAQIKQQSSHLCDCGAIWESHLKKDGDLNKRYANGKHFVQGRTNMNRATRRAMRRR